MFPVPVVLAPFVAILIMICYILQYLETRSQTKSSQARAMALREQLRYESLDVQRRMMLPVRMKQFEPDTIVCPKCHSPVKVTGVNKRPDGTIQCTSCFEKFIPHDID